MDLTQVGIALTTFAAGVGAVLVKWKPWASSSKADTAANEAEAAMYQRLRSDIDALSSDVQRLRAELDRERTHGRNLEQYIWQLQGLMRAANIEPPPMPAYPALAL
jgi:hypothetical protein